MSEARCVMTEMLDNAAAVKGKNFAQLTSLIGAFQTSAPSILFSGDDKTRLEIYNVLAKATIATIGAISGLSVADQNEAILLAKRVTAAGRQANNE